MPKDVSFGHWLQQHRRALDLTQTELARRVDCAKVTIQKIESEERRPSKDIAARLAEVLALPAEERPAFLHFVRDASSTHLPALPSRTVPSIPPSDEVRNLTHLPFPSG